MNRADPRRIPTYRVRVTAETVARARDVADALLDVPDARDDDVARLVVSIHDPPEEADAHVVVVPAEPPKAAGDAPVFTLREADRAPEAHAPLAGGAAREIVVGPGLAGIDVLRAALLDAALAHLGVTVDGARRAKRPFATAIIASATLIAGAEGVLPGAAAFVVATQVSAVASLYYLYTGKWMGRSQALSILPVLATEAAGGSVFLFVKSFLPPTGVGDVAAAAVAASMTLAILGAIAAVLEEGYALDETDKLRAAFQRMRARTKAERAHLARNRHLWKDKSFLRDLVRRLVFQ